MREDEQAVMCVLMLRGAQTPGELKQRTERMHAFGDLAAVHETLERLIARGLIARLERRPGHKEERYAQLLQGDDEGDGRSQQPSTAPAPDAQSRAPYAPAPDEDPHAPAHAAPHAPAATDDLGERVARLEREVAELRAAMRHPVHEHQP